MWLTFAWGCLGSAAIEVVTICQSYESEKPFPDRYKKFGFWVVRTLLLVLAGGLAVAYGITNEILAFHVGVATPLIIGKLAETVPPVVANANRSPESGTNTPGA